MNVTWIGNFNKSKHCNYLQNMYYFKWNRKSKKNKSIWFFVQSTTSFIYFFIGVEIKCIKLDIAAENIKPKSATVLFLFSIYLFNFFYFNLIKHVCKTCYRKIHGKFTDSKNTIFIAFACTIVQFYINYSRKWNLQVCYLPLCQG